MIVALAGLVVVGLFLFTQRSVQNLESEFSPRGEFVEIDGARLHLTRCDPAGAPKGDVVLIHGASGNQADMMRPLGEPLAALGYRVFAVDRPGHGFSTRLNGEPASPAEQARAIRSALEKLGVEDALIVGHSWAGSIAANFVLDHADFATGAVLLAPVTHPWPGGIRWYYKLATTPVLGWLFTRLVVMPMGLATLDSAIAGVFAPMPTPPGYAARTGAALALRPRVFRGNAEDVVRLRAFLEEQAPRLPQIRRPVAIVAGDHDGVVLTERHCYGCERDIPGADLVMLPGVGHSPHWAKAPAVVAAIESVFARIQSPRRIRPETSASAPAASSQ